MNARNNLKIDAVAVALALVASGAFYAFAVQPVLSLRQKQAAQWRALEAQKRVASQGAAKLANVKQALADTQKRFSELAVQLQPAGNINTRISKLTELAAASKLKIDEVRPSEPTYGADYGSVPIVLDGSGSFNTWAAFLRELAGQFPDTAVETFQLSRKSDEPSSPVQFHVNLVWYVSPQNAPAVAPSPAAAPAAAPHASVTVPQ